MSVATTFTTFFGDFQYHHIPALYLAAALGLGGLLPFVGYPRQALVAYGLPPRVADRPEAWSAMKPGWARMSCLGFLFLIFYQQRKYDALDTMLGVVAGYLALADSYILWGEGVRGYAFFRLGASLAISAMGFAGLTQGKVF